MDFKQIEAFVNVMKYKSFSKAADASFLTQPTISTHVSSLERELGVTLIDRKGKESRPTKAGRAFYSYAINMINTREKAVMALGNTNSDFSGSIDLRTSSIPGQYLVPELLAAFRREHPQTHFYVEQSDSRQVWDSIVNNEGDLGFTGEYQNNSLGYEVLTRDPIVLITPKNEKFLNLKEKSDSLPLKEFCGEAFVWREDGSATRNSFEKKINNIYPGSRMDVAVSVNNLESVKRCVAAGLGVSVLSELVTAADGNQAGYLTFHIADVQMEREFYLVYNKNVMLSPLVSHFKEFARNYFKKE